MTKKEITFQKRPKEDEGENHVTFCGGAFQVEGRTMTKPMKYETVYSKKKESGQCS